MPDRWFGYDAADVVVLATGSETFINRSERRFGRPHAARPWPSGCGAAASSIVSVGANRQLAAEVLDKMPLRDSDKMPLLDCAHRGRRDRAPRRPTSPAGSPRTAACHALKNVEITRLTPGAGVTVLVSESGQGRRQDDGLPRRRGGVLRPGPRLADRLRPGRAAVHHAGVAGGPEGVLDAGPGRVHAASRRRRAPQPMQPGMASGDERAAGPARPRCSAPWKTSRTCPSSASAGWPCSSSIYILIVGPLDYFLLNARLQAAWS